MVLAEPAPTALPIALVPIVGAEGVLAVADAASDEAGHVQALVDGQLGATGTLGVGEHVVGAFARGGEIVVVTSERGGLAVSALGAAGLVRRGASPVTGHAVVDVEGRLVVLRADVPPPPEEEDADASAPRPRAPKPAAARPARGAKKKKGHGAARDEAVARMMKSGRELAVLAQPLTAEGAPDGEPVDTTIRFVEPMSGLGLVGAGGRGARTDVVFFEASDGKVWRPSPGAKGPRPKHFGRLGIAVLDASLAVVDRRAFGESPLEAGFLTERVDPRLVTTPEGSVVLGLRSLRGRCDATVVTPFGMPMIPDDTGCKLDPRRFVIEARARHAGDPVPALAAPALDPRRAHRAPEQPAWDVGRSVIAGARAYTIVGDDVLSWASDGATRTEPRPLVAQRARVWWSAVGPGGRVAAGTSLGVVAVDHDGARRALGDAPRFVDGPDRPDVRAATGRVVTWIGERAFAARGELRALGSDAPGAALHPDATLVGGAEGGLVVALASGALSIRVVGPDGAPRGPARVIDGPVGPGFEAIERPGGGALVVGPSRRDPRRVVAFALDREGLLGPTHELDLPAPALGRLRLAPTPSGAIAFDAGLTRAAWIDAAGALAASAAWPAARSDARCVDGVPAPRAVPDAAPGRFLDVPALATPGTCVVGAFGWAPDGLRWVTSVARGPHARVELVHLPGAVAAPAERPTLALSGGITLSPTCPGDMVSVDGDRFCIDRFEGTLVDADAGRYLSPDYPSTPNLLTSALGDWATRRERGGDLAARALPLPSLDPWQLGATHRARAVSRGGVRPSGFVTGLVARSACREAGKRLCTTDEWRTACRGEQSRPFPYGNDYEDGTCNVNGPHHPASLLHGHASIGHLDPRLDRVEVGGQPLLRLTGGSPRCTSAWGRDRVHDMVGNLDEWVDAPGGAFAGGFFARGTRAGCDALVDAHPESYLDYSTGIRCCSDPGSAP